MLHSTIVPDATVRKLIRAGEIAHKQHLLKRLIELREEFLKERKNIPFCAACTICLKDTHICRTVAERDDIMQRISDELYAINEELGNRSSR